ncbi:3'-5' exonuclease [Allobaculum stercoricanis]|uniref:3'-5' exonuclease n=1 Tax=Allobaculum stercoricanis TaxID=174709 RepID=UPI000375993F|nr:3'-5' exonuclease [Allobaculum stercoricanis]
MARKHCLKKILNDYCVIDTETTGLSSVENEMIEIGILRIRNGKIVSRYSQLIHPRQAIDPFITNLTGITNEMVEHMPYIDEVKSMVLDFIGNDVLLGHNIRFDINFLNAGFDMEIQNDLMDTLQFAKKLYPELAHHRLTDLSNYLHLISNEHRALADCMTTYQLYETIKQTMRVRQLQPEDLWVSLKRKK